MKNFIMYFILLCFGAVFSCQADAGPPVVKDTITIDVGDYQTVSCVEFNVQWKQNADFLSKNPANYKGCNYTKTPILAGKSFLTNKMPHSQSEREVLFATRFREVNSDIFILCGK